MVVNFKARGISQGARKLARTPILIKKKKNTTHNLNSPHKYPFSSHFPSTSINYHLPTIILVIFLLQTHGSDSSSLTHEPRQQTQNDKHHNFPLPLLPSSFVLPKPEIIIIKVILFFCFVQANQTSLSISRS